ncbi:protein trichome birefringence-like 14 [Dorcoceras hygrometricum]|uniref:Protein trichome birefringence-like 14 n=1 Tax=Dorcoceras hygrometricum TaxID=472368 RepID=A0A2Z7AIM7_9LAMI|nr:protein trichome birefringence-like 14 [Dorcoceras hygrometricum]
MKGAQLSRFWGRQFSFIMAALVFTTMFFWCWESNPILMGLLSAPEQFATHTSDLYVDDAADSSTMLNSKELLMEEISHSQVLERTEYDKSAESSERKYENKVISFFEKQGMWSCIPPTFISFLAIYYST